jgi:hypothetical protein
MTKHSWVLVFVALVGCKKAEEASGKTGSDARDAVIDAWKKGGLTVSPMTPSTVAFAKDCQSGTVGAVDVLVCVFPSAADAKAAEDAGLAWVGDTTGASQAHGAALIAVADRRKSDPSGRTINQMMKLAPK